MSIQGSPQAVRSEVTVLCGRHWVPWVSENMEPCFSVFLVFHLFWQMSSDSADLPAPPSGKHLPALPHMPAQFPSGFSNWHLGTHQERISFYHLQSEESRFSNDMK